eukprot:TRINITY_DN13410_c0_g4_i1.p1 TRINITY_DN13410_c0_g4~~TRINITY_DN13410_c0_g4_i1.p1  ORF type:complete len:262 (+),score=63.11 TRINITY_DN13410_c0_g4_i1:69-788(+)
MLSMAAVRNAAKAFVGRPAGTNLLEGIDLPNSFKGKAVLDSDEYSKMDKKNDKVFYKRPRLESHMSPESLQAITKYYETALKGGEGVKHLEMCASAYSYFPKGYNVGCHGLGLNGEELNANKALTDGYTVQNLNKVPVLDFADDAFTVCTHVASIEYLTDPVAHCKELRRVLCPSAPLHVIFTNRAFWTKSTKVWAGASHEERIFLAALYLSYAGFTDVKAFNLPQADTEPVAVVTGSA